MAVAKLLTSSTPYTMKLEGEKDSLDTFIKQAVGFSLSRTGDSPTQWIQLLHNLDQEDLPGWPLLPPSKVQMQKCDKCAREFCSTIDYRRHILVHRRSLNVDKEFHKNRDLLGNFWDTLTLDEAMEVMSFKDVTLGEVPGSSITSEISSNLGKSGFSALPQVYVKAGTTLVDIIQGRPSILPLSSQELFSILDDASERTFLCAGTAECVQKYVFDGDAAQIGLETKNLIACTSFLVEQKLVKAWLAHKEAEALRCQNLLVKEEEAAQKRQAEVLEKKRQRKLRQKEQRAKDQSNGEKTDLNSTSDIFESPPTTGSSSPPASVEADSNVLESSLNHVHVSLELIEFSNDAQDIVIEAQGGSISDTCEQSDWGTFQNVEPQNVSGNDHKRTVVTRLQKGGGNGIHASHNNVRMLKRETAQKYGPYRDQRAGPISSSKVWTKKPKSDTGGELTRNRVENDATNQTDQANRQVMIGSISVTVTPSTAQQQVTRVEVQDSNNMELKESSVRAGKWRQKHEARGQLASRNRRQVSLNDASDKGVDRIMPSESCLQSHEVNGNDSKVTDNFHPLVDVGEQPGVIPYSYEVAIAFHAKRWKEALLGEHEIVSSEPKSLCDPDAMNDDSQASDSQQHSILDSSSAENQSDNAVGVVPLSPNGNGKAKFRRPDKGGGGVQRKYAQKQKKSDN